jgi:predicted small metal-binding protein
MTQANLTARCECGVVLSGANEDEFVRHVQEHVSQSHPGVSVTREHILAMAERAAPQEPAP